MDTWATSSLTPQINSHWGLDKNRHQKLFPADLRPQAHEIIRTWAFYTIVKSFFHSTDPSKNPPWKHIAISGWVMNPQRLKMSKSKGGKSVLSPEELMDKYSPDAIRYWAGKARLGMDTIYDENVFKVGKKLTIKLNNAFQFIQIQIKGMENFFAHEAGSAPDTGSISNAGSAPDTGSTSDTGSALDTGSTSDVGSAPEKDPALDTGDFIASKGALISSALDHAWMIYLLDVHCQATALLKRFHYAEALDLIEKAFGFFAIII